MVALAVVLARSSQGRPIKDVLTKAKAEMQKTVEFGRMAAKACGEEKRSELEAQACQAHARAAEQVMDLRAAIRGSRALIIDRYARNGGRVRIEMSDFPTLSAGGVDVCTPNGTTWGEIATKGVKIPLCHIRSIQVIW